MGYRWFDQQNRVPLYPFGHGLSYTSFTYSKPKAARAADGGLDVSFTIKNTGKAASDEVRNLFGCAEVRARRRTIRGQSASRI